jgi:hypothetical protein
VTSPVGRVPLAQVGNLLTPGQPLPFKLVDPLGRLLLAAGQCIADARQLAALFERGACADIDEVEAARQLRSHDGGPGGGLAPSSRRLTLFDRWEQQIWALDALFRSLGRTTGCASAIEAFADDQIALVDRDGDAALFVCIRQDDRRFALYGLTHSLYAASVSLLAARSLGWPAARARSAVLAALTMNVSIADLQARMAEQPDPPTKKQIEQIRGHPQRSADMLRSQGVADAEWLGAVEDHHERAGGGGYPRGLQEAGEVARVVRAVDVYMAKISPRAMRAPIAPQQAARQLFQEEGGGPVASALIKAVGVYPPGDFVRLRNGEAAIVVHRATANNAALVVAVQDASGRPLSSAPRRDTGQPEFAIAGALAERKGLPRVRPEQVYGLLDA